MVVVEQSNVLPSSVAGTGLTGERGLVVDNPFFAEIKEEEEEKDEQQQQQEDDAKEEEVVGKDATIEEDRDEEVAAARAAFGDDAIAILKNVEERERQEKGRLENAEQDDDSVQKTNDGDNGNRDIPSITDSDVFKRVMSSTSTTSILAPREATTTAAVPSSTSSSSTIATTAAPLLQALVSGHATQVRALVKSNT